MQAIVLRIVRHSRLKRGVFRPAMSRLLNLLREGPIDTTYQGAPFRFHHLASGTERGALLNPDYNLAELDFLRRHTPPEGVFIDIGANVGTYAIVLSRHVGPSGCVIAIEPHPTAHARLAFNNSASNYNNVRLLQIAIGDADGDVMIETDVNNLGASHIVPKASGTTIKVEARRLLAVLEDNGIAQVDSLKIDVEGYEDHVLSDFFRKAQKTLWPRAVVIEHLSKGDWQKHCISDMIDRGYVITGKTRSNTMLTLGSLEVASQIPQT